MRSWAARVWAAWATASAAAWRPPCVVASARAVTVWISVTWPWTWALACRARVGQVLHLAGDHRESPPVIARARRLDGRVQRQQVNMSAISASTSAIRLICVTCCSTVCICSSSPRPVYPGGRCCGWSARRRPGPARPRGAPAHLLLTPGRPGDLPGGRRQLLDRHADFLHRVALLGRRRALLLDGRGQRGGLPRTATAIVDRGRAGQSPTRPGPGRSPGGRSRSGRQQSPAPGCRRGTHRGRAEISSIQ